MPHDPTNRPQIPAPRTRRALPPADHDRAPDSPAPSLEDKAPRAAALREWWDDAWDDGGFLHNRWEDLRSTRSVGWHGTAPWIKTLALAAAFSLTVLLLDAALNVLLHAVHDLLTAAPHVQVGTDTTSGLWAVIDHPVRRYITNHATGLPVSASTLYTAWLAAGTAALIGGTLRFTGARITWWAWGAATVAMVWEAAPADAHTLATGTTVLAWTLASTFALRGMSIRPTLFTSTHIHNNPPAVQPQTPRHASDNTSHDNAMPLQ